MSDWASDVIVTNAVLVLKSLVQIRIQQQQNAIAYGGLPSQSFSPLEIISRLARRLDEIRHPKARACVLWLVGQYAASPETAPGTNGVAHIGPEGIAPWAPDVLRKTAKTFGQEVCFIPAAYRSRPLSQICGMQTAAVKLQTITLAAKLLVLSPADRIIGLLNRYVFSLARYDLNYDVRDRGRMLSALLAGVNANLYGEGDDWHEDVGGVVLRREQVRMVLFEGKSSLGEDKMQDGTSIPCRAHARSWLWQLMVAVMFHDRR